jgi:type III pantothenate kinase
MDYQLAIDRGNTFTKLSVFDGHQLIRALSVDDENLAHNIAAIISEFHIQHSIFSDVRDGYSNAPILNSLPAGCLFMSTLLRFPFTLEYSTPETIGHDRLANLAGAWRMGSGRNILVVDFGTCITYSLLLNGSFVGGSIAPGRNMRLRALHEFTGRLPLEEMTNTTPILLGNSTQGSIHSGVDYAAVLETDSMIAAYGEHFDNPDVWITGGDYSFFENHLKSATFAAPQLTQLGLHEILRTNIP